MGKQILRIILILLTSSSLLLSQSLVEVAKKEKERRAKLKGKSGKVVTNEDLERIKKDPKVVTNEDLKKNQRQPGVSISPQPSSDEKPSEKAEKPETGAALTEPAISEQAEADETRQLKNLELKYEKAKAQVDMLTAKMNGLFMKYYSPDNTTPQQMIQSEISRTALQLQKARDDQEKAKKEIEDYRSKKHK
ncbi:MAG: hypothetical protein PVH84_00665 [Candidatus Aminicenantes bacterium]